MPRPMMERKNCKSKCDQERGVLTEKEDPKVDNSSDVGLVGGCRKEEVREKWRW